MGKHAIDFKLLDRLADQHVPHDRWRSVTVELNGRVDRDGNEHWSVEARYRSDGGASRHIWVHGATPTDAAQNAAAIFEQPWSRWGIFEAAA